MERPQMPLKPIPESSVGVLSSESPKRLGCGKERFLWAIPLIVLMSGCGTVFTARQGEITHMAIKVSNPGKATIKIETKTACTVNARGPLDLTMTCQADEAPWYSGFAPVCIPDPCVTGSLVHNPDGTVGCK